MGPFSKKRPKKLEDPGLDSRFLNINDEKQMSICKERTFDDPYPPLSQIVQGSVELPDGVREPFVSSKAQKKSVSLG